MRFQLLSLAVVVGAFTACRPPKIPNANQGVSTDELSHTNMVAPEASTLGTGDLVEVRVFQEPDLSGAYRVSSEGTIDYPLCGKVVLNAMTSSQAADALTQCLQKGYLKNPQVSVLIREFTSKKVFVFGEVQKPGTFPYEQNMTIIQAITLAGGFTKLAGKNNTNVTRIIAGQERKVRVPVEDIGVGREKNFVLQPGDIVFIPESLF